MVITYDQLIATGILDSVFLTNSVLSFVSSVVIRDLIVSDYSVLITDE